MLAPRGRVAQLEEPLLNKQMVGWDRILAQTIEKKCSGAPKGTISELFWGSFCQVCNCLVVPRN